VVVRGDFSRGRVDGGGDAQDSVQIIHRRRVAKIFTEENLGNKGIGRVKGQTKGKKRDAERQSQDKSTLITLPRNKVNRQNQRDDPQKGPRMAHPTKRTLTEGSTKTKANLKTTETTNARRNTRDRKNQTDATMEATTRCLWCGFSVGCVVVVFLFFCSCVFFFLGR